MAAGLNLDPWWDEPAYKTCNTFRLRGLFILRKLREPAPAGAALTARKVVNGRRVSFRRSECHQKRPRMARSAWSSSSATSFRITYSEDLPSLDCRSTWSLTAVT